MAQPTRLPNRELVRRLAPFGVIVKPKRGKGSEVVLQRETIPGSGQGPLYTIKWHKNSDEQNPSVIKKILDRFGIKPEDFW